MSAKRFIPGAGGVYAVTLKRGPAKGKEKYGLRLWRGAEGKYRCFNLGMDYDRALARRDAIVRDPDAALAKRNQKAAPAAPVFEALVNQFLATYRAKGGTSDAYKPHAASWIARFGKVPADTITRAMVEDYRDGLRRDKYGDSTIRKYVGGLSTLYKWARGRGLIADSPVLAWSRLGEGVTRPAEPDHEIDVVSRDEQAKFEQAADPLTRTIIALFCASGMRAGGRGDTEEGLKLRWSQVDREQGSILIPRSKNHKARAIPINGPLAAALDRVTIRGEYVFSDAAGKRLDYFTVERLLQSALDRAGIVKAGGVFNMMRHTFGSRLAEKGVGFATIAKIMGNTAAVCERSYIRFSPGHLKAAMATLDDPSFVPQSAPQMGKEALAMVAPQSQTVLH